MVTMTSAFPHRFAEVLRNEALLRMTEGEQAGSPLRDEIQDLRQMHRVPIGTELANLRAA